MNKGVLIGTMGRFLSGNVSDSFRRVQYLFRLYSLPHRAGGMKKPLARDEGAVLAGSKQTSGDTHTHSPKKVPKKFQKSSKKNQKKFQKKCKKKCKKSLVTFKSTQNSAQKSSFPQKSSQFSVLKSVPKKLKKKVQN